MYFHLEFSSNSNLFLSVKPIEIVQGASRSSVIDAIYKPDEKSASNETIDNLSTNSRTSPDILYRPTTVVSHHRSNTVPSRPRKFKKKSSPTSTHLSPTYKSSANSQSLLQILAKQQPIRLIDDETDGSQTPSSNSRKQSSFRPKSGS